MCGGGGGGGDGGAADREAARQKEQDAAIGRINSLFGVSSGDTLTAPDRNDPKFKTQRRVSRAGYRNEFDESLFNEALNEYNAAVQQNKDSESNKLKLDTLYQGIGDDVSAYLTKDLNDQYEDAERNGRFNAARRGIRGGSSELDMKDGIQEDFDKSILDISNRASDASSRMRIADSKTRLDMIQRILQGMSGDAAITTAQQSLKDNSESIRRQALSQSLDNVFRDTSYMNDKNLERRGIDRANEYWGTYFPQYKQYSGSTN